MEKEYNIFKIEKKHDKWMVTLESGEYSDYGKDVIIISAGSYEEAWHYVKKLHDLKKLPQVSYFYEHPVIKLDPTVYPEDGAEYAWEETRVTIEQLPVYYFKNI